MTITREMVEAAYIAFTRSYGSTPIGTNDTRTDLRKALEAAMPLYLRPAPAGESEAAKALEIIRDVAYTTAQKHRADGKTALADMIESALAALSPAGEAVQMKPLLWIATSSDEWQASTILAGPNYIIFSEGDPAFVFRAREYGTLDDAKAAAQADLRGSD